MRMLAFVALVVAGCGGSVDPFLGTWDVTNTDGMNVCPPVPSDITGTQEAFTFTASGGELFLDACKQARLSVAGDRASLAAPADCDFAIFDTFHYKQLDLETTDGQTVSGTVMGEYDSNPPGCRIVAHFAGRKVR